MKVIIGPHIFSSVTDVKRMLFLICFFLICELFLFTSGCDNGCIMADTSCVNLSYICKQRIYSDVCNAACNNEAVPNNDLLCKYKGKDVNFFEYFNNFNGINDPVICPKMIVPPQSPVNLIIDSTNVKVSCNGTKQPVRYYKNGVELQKEVNNGQLLFPKVDESIKGIYTCGVINDENRRSSDMFEIRVNTPPTLNLTMIPQSPKKDDDVTLYCNITAGIPVPNLTWKFNGKEVKQVDRYSKYSVFRIASFQPSNSGKYECIGKNAAGKVTKQITITPPKLNLTMISESPSVTIYCKITAGIPVPNVTWTFNGKEVKQVERYSKYSVFRIASFQPIDSGKYVCIGKNVAGIATKQITIPEAKGMHGGYKALLVIGVLILIGIVIAIVVLKYTLIRKNARTEKRIPIPETEKEEIKGSNQDNDEKNGSNQEDVGTDTSDEVNVLPRKSDLMTLLPSTTYEVNTKPSTSYEVNMLHAKETGNGSEHDTKV